MHDPRLTEMLKAEEDTKARLLDPTTTELRIPFGFYPEQVGMQECMCTSDGRIWRMSDRGRVAIVIFDPKWLSARDSA